MRPWLPAPRPRRSPAFGAWDRIELALVNGRYAPGLARVPALPGGAWVGGLAAAIANPIVADRIDAHARRDRALAGARVRRAQHRADRRRHPGARRART